MTISGKRILKNIKAGSISSAEDSPASHIALPEKGWEKKTPGTSGQKCLEQFGKYNQHGLWAKMFAALLVGMEGWCSTRCNLIWRLRDTAYSRFYFQLQVSTLRTEESASGLLPTVLASDGTRRGEPLRGKRKIRPTGQVFSPNLSDLAKNGLLPTPTVMEDRTKNITAHNYQKKKGNLATAALLGLLPTPTTGNNRNSRNAVQKIGHAHQNHGVAMGLSQVVEIAMGVLPKEFDSWQQVPAFYKTLLPTPTAQDFKRRGPNSGQQGLSNTENWLHLIPAEVVKTKGKDSQTDVGHSLIGERGRTSQLNPRFVMEMMGFPPDWTALPFLNGDRKV